MDSDEIFVASSPRAPRDMRHDSPLEENIDTTNKPAATAVKKQFKVPKGPYRTPAGFDNPKELKDDLADFGFSNKRVRELIGKHEPVVDGQGQIPQHYVTVGVEGDNGGAGAGAGGNGAGRERGQRGVANKVKYDHLVLTPESNWVLFDPLRGYPSHLREPPRVFQQFETFQEGNARVLEFNVVSESVRIRSTPEVLVGREVRYSKVGPKLVDIKGKGKLAGGGRARQAKVEVKVEPEVEDSQGEDGGLSEGGEGQSVK